VYFLTNDSERLGKLEDFLDKLSREASRNSQAEIKFEIQALTDITPGKYLSMITAGLGPQWDIDRFYFFGTICLLILLPAFLNDAIYHCSLKQREVELANNRAEEIKTGQCPIAAQGPP